MENIEKTVETMILELWKMTKGMQQTETFTPEDLPILSKKQCESGILAQSSFPAPLPHT